MKLTKKATSVIEAMIVLLIVVVWVVWLYDIYITSQKFSDSTKHRIEAIEIAREWVEAMKNIRDTNWLLFWANINNCWNVLNYNPLCISGGWTSINWTYIIDKTADNRWDLTSKTSVAYWASYKNTFWIYKDSDWFYTHSPSVAKVIFTREITIFYVWTTMNIKSIVKWMDSSSTNPHTVDIDLELTNWRK